MQLYYIHKGNKPTFCTILLLFVVRYPTFLGQIYWSSSESHLQRCSNSELSHVVTTVVVFTVIKIIKIDL